jgi:hypothetical protein
MSYVIQVLLFLSLMFVPAREPPEYQLLPVTNYRSHYNYYEMKLDTRTNYVVITGADNDTGTGFYDPKNRFLYVHWIIRGTFDGFPIELYAVGTYYLDNDGNALGSYTYLDNPMIFPHKLLRQTDK